MRDELAERAGELRRSRTPFVHATVVRAQHPTSAHAGDAALVHADGAIEGFVGGTCAEASVRAQSLRVLVTGEPLLLRITPGEESEAVVDEEGAVTVANPCLSGGTLEIFLEPHRPAPRVIVVGSTPVAHALAALGGPLGLHVELTDGGSARPDPDDAAMIVASHGRGEEPALAAALHAGVPYVALVASRTRGGTVLAGLDVSEADRSRVHSPAGLDLGARTAGEIALSILAEMITERADTVPTPQQAVPATAVDPVCGMTVAASSSTLQAAYGGEQVYFCGEHCRTTFLADPAGFAG
ncbi:MAG: XdhC family protein [Geodermatophilaceae bacterium]|nr:XdhC family protein [Geodermatophilaceae bacterium]